MKTAIIKICLCYKGGLRFSDKYVRGMIFTENTWTALLFNSTYIT